MEEYTFEGTHILRDARHKEKILRTNRFRGEFFRDEFGEIIGECYLHADYNKYSLVGRLLMRKNHLLLNLLAERGTSNGELPRELQFIQHGHHNSFNGTYGGGIRIASPRVIDRLDKGMNPFLKDPEMWTYCKINKNSTLNLLLCN